MKHRSLGEKFVADLLAVMPTPEAKLRLLTALAQFEGCTIYLARAPKAARRVRAASNMLANGIPPADAAHAIRERFAVTARTAFRDVAAARKMSSGNVSNRADDEGSQTA